MNTTLGDIARTYWLNGDIGVVDIIAGSERRQAVSLRAGILPTISWSGTSSGLNFEIADGFGIFDASERQQLLSIVTIESSALEARWHHEYRATNSDDDRASSGLLETALLYGDDESVNALYGLIINGLTTSDRRSVDMLQLYYMRQRHHGHHDIADEHQHLLTDHSIHSVATWSAADVASGVLNFEAYLKRCSEHGRHKLSGCWANGTIASTYFLQTLRIGRHWYQQHAKSDTIRYLSEPSHDLELLDRAAKGNSATRARLLQQRIVTDGAVTLSDIGEYNDTFGAARFPITLESICSEHTRSWEIAPSALRRYGQFGNGNPFEGSVFNLNVGDSDGFGALCNATTPISQHIADTLSAVLA